MEETTQKYQTPKANSTLRKGIVRQSSRVDEIINGVIKILDSKLGGRNNYSLYLFGSRAKEQASARADIDLAVSCPEIDDDKMRSIIREIANQRTLYHIDLVHLQSIEPEIRGIILSQAIKIND